MNKKEILIKETQAILGDYSGMKITLRQAYYRLVVKQVIENKLSQYKYFSKILVEARRNGSISYDVFEDRTRSIVNNMSFGYDEDYYTDEYFLNSAIQSFEDSIEPHQPFYYSRWYNQPNRIMVLCEKEALANIFEEVCDSQNVKFAPIRGYSSETLKHQIAFVLKTWTEDNLNPILLYFGDFDPTGKDIPRDLQSALKILGASNFKYELCALTSKQIETWKLPSVPAKKSDSRSKKFIEKFGDKVVELDAIEPKLLRSLIKSEILKRFDIDIYLQNKEDAKDREKEVNKKLKSGFKDYLKNVDLSTFILDE